MSLDPVTLRVASGALRATCEEMGAVLIRASHSANIKERRDASCALFDPDGELVMQAEHIPVHLGAMPAAVAAVAGEDARGRRQLGPQRPLRRRHPPARHHGDHARLRRRRADRVRRQPRPSRRRRRPDARLDARRLQDARRRRRGDLAAHPRRGRDRASSPSRCASPRSAAPTCAPSSPPTAPGSTASGAARADAAGRGDGGDDRLRRAAHPRRDRGARGRRLRGRRTCSRPPRATSSCA